MMHDFALTDRYVVLFDLPVTFSMDAVSAGRKCLTPGTRPTRPRVGLLPRDGGPASIRWFEIEPCWVFHTLNAYDDGGPGRRGSGPVRGAYDVSALEGERAR